MIEIVQIQRDVEAERRGRGADVPRDQMQPQKGAIFGYREDCTNETNIKHATKLLNQLKAP